MRIYCDKHDVDVHSYPNSPVPSKHNKILYFMYNRLVYDIRYALNTRMQLKPNAVGSML